MEINIKNIEEIIFYDKILTEKLPEFRHLFDQWRLAQRVQSLKNIIQGSIFEVLNSLNEKHIKILEEYFSEEVFVNKINNKLVANFELSLDDPDKLCEFAEYRDFCLHRNKDQFSITFWR
jgi:hypothetical protein